MPTTLPVIQFGTMGWLALLSFIIATISRLLKADLLNSWLQKMSLPSLPKAAVPWIALVLGFAGGFLSSKIGGSSWEDSALMGVWGLFSGGGAIAGHESLEKPVRALMGEQVGNVLFGKPTVLVEAKSYGTPPKLEVNPVDMGDKPPSPPKGPSVNLVGMTFLALCLSLSGCATLPAVAAAIPTVILAVTDAEQILSAISAAERSYFLTHQDPELEKKIAQAELDARLALDVVLRTTKTAQSIEDKDLVASIVNFQKAYTSLSDLLNQIGVKPTADSSALKVARASGYISIPQPMLMQMRAPK